ncbi:putative Zn finger protein [Myroides gitamensis]|uniref:Uncharacterized protein n=1 Tax=Myroides odoratus TaxID=256 RepID=A0A378U6E7_MYROD|nr:hypothetical protein [Myroides odoratus]MCS4237609.1 putative Zn finger protein [Myroides odoratus]MDH6601652.1 putative Zn finger protein [Myroides gitamensis]QQU02865.1 hypothetical protein I6I89_13705 [Myroides odoratus]STZ69902.1 Uncharacterised protein [Myroides odoratus]
MLKKMKMTALSVLAIAVGMVAYGHKQEVDLEVNVEQVLRYEVIVETSGKARITSIQVKEGARETETMDHDGRRWSRSFAGDVPVVVAVTGHAVQGESSVSKMTVQVFKDGTLVQNGVAEGENLIVNVSF